jgi:hypothetical protein
MKIKELFGEKASELIGQNEEQLEEGLMGLIKKVAISRYGSLDNVPEGAHIEFNSEETKETLPYVAAMLFDCAKNYLKKTDKGVYKIITREKGEAEIEALVNSSRIVNALKKLFKHYA